MFLVIPRAVLLRLASAPVRLAIEEDEARTPRGFHFSQPAHPMWLIHFASLEKRSLA